MPLLQEHMSHVVVARVDDEPLDPPDVAIGGMDLLAAAHGHLAQGEPVVGDGPRSSRRFGAHAAHHAEAHAAPQAEAVVGPGKHLARTIGLVTAARNELRLLG